MIPHGLKRGDVFSAAAQIDRDGVPAANKSRRYFLVINGKQYPPKYIIRLATYHAGLKLKDYNAVEAKNYFHKRGYQIIDNKVGASSPIDQVAYKIAASPSSHTNYWWVNHKQTHSDEIEGGYIWSPKTNANGGRNQTYLNLTEVTPGDIIFSYASGMIKAIGVATSRYCEQPQPSEFGTTGYKWAKIGWVVPIQWEVLQKPILPKDYLAQISPLLPDKYSPIQSNGNGNQSCYLASISQELGKLLTDLGLLYDEGGVYAAINESEDQRDKNSENTINQAQIPHTEKEQLIKSRVGQGLFRINVEKIEKGCRVTGVRRKDLLIASHIKPWRDSNNDERLDGSNGLLLAPHVDKLFDRGWISFTDKGDLLKADMDISAVLIRWGINQDNNVGTFSAEQSLYLEYHRDQVFRGRLKNSK